MALETAGQRQLPAISGSVTAWGFNLFCQNVSITERQGSGLSLLREGEGEGTAGKALLYESKQTDIMTESKLCLKGPRPSLPDYAHSVFGPHKHFLQVCCLHWTAREMNFHWGGKPDRDHVFFTALVTPIGWLGALAWKEAESCTLPEQRLQSSVSGYKGCVQGHYCVCVFVCVCVRCSCMRPNEAADISRPTHQPIEELRLILQNRHRLVQRMHTRFCLHHIESLHRQYTDVFSDLQSARTVYSQGHAIHYIYSNDTDVFKCFHIRNYFT